MDGVELEDRGGILAAGPLAGAFEGGACLLCHTEERDGQEGYAYDLRSAVGRGDSVLALETYVKPNMFNIWGKN